MSKIHLSDPDNRDDSGASYEFTGSVDRVIKYLDGPLRSDVTEGGRKSVDAARRVGVYLREAHDDRA